MFKEGDAVRIKPNTTLENGTVVQDWAGIVEEVLSEDNCCIILLDAPTLDGLEDDYLEQRLLEGDLPFLEVIDFENLESSTRRDTEEELKRALEDLTDRAMDLEDALEQQRVAQQEELLAAFEKSNSYKNLTAAQQQQAEFVFDFMDTLYEYEGLVYQQWTPEAIKIVCLKEIPGTWIVEAEVFEHLGAVVVAFLQFLGAEKQLPQADALIKTVQAIQSQIPLAAQNKKNWYDPKPLLMEALEAGVDLNDPKAVDAFFLAKEAKKK